MRDRFAEKAMNGIMQTRYSEEFMREFVSKFLGLTLAEFKNETHYTKFVAKLAYLQADAMMEERRGE